MFSKTWNHNTLRKYVILFGTLFNNIWITRDNSTGASIQTLKVPLSYGPQEKFLARLDGNPSLANKVGVVLPRISFEMTSFTYDSERKLNTLNRIYKQPTNNSTDGHMAYQYMPVPYNITFQMSIMVKNAEDGTRINTNFVFIQDCFASFMLYHRLLTPFTKAINFAPPNVLCNTVFPFS